MRADSSRLSRLGGVSSRAPPESPCRRADQLRLRHSLPVIRVIVDELISLLGYAATILVVGGVVVLLVVSRRRRADPRWKRISTVTQGFVVAVLVLAVEAVLFAMSSDDPRLRF